MKDSSLRSVPLLRSGFPVSKGQGFAGSSETLKNYKELNIQELVISGYCFQPSANDK